MGLDAALLAAIAFAGALIFGITGFGSALVTIPLATHLVPLKFALALFALVDLCCALSVGLENPKNAKAQRVGAARADDPGRHRARRDAARQPAARRRHVPPR